MLIVTVIRTIVSYLLFTIIILIVALPTLIFLLLPERWRYDNKLYYWLAHFFYTAILKCSFVPITFVGTENIPQGPVIFASNHQSSLDIPLLGALTRAFPHIWLAKKELREAPILGFLLSRMAIFIDMSTPQKGVRSLIKAVNSIYGKQRHAIIFPEGERYIDGKVHDFYAGFVILAKKTGRPVVPVRIFNAYKVYPPGSFLAYRHPVKVVIGKPFVFQEGESDEAFKERVYSWFIEQGEG